MSNKDHDWVDRCLAIPEIDVSKLDDGMVKYYAYLYTRISNAVDAMGGMANFAGWMNDHAKSYFQTCKNQETEIAELKAIIVESNALLEGCSQCMISPGLEKGIAIHLINVENYLENKNA